MMWMTKVNFMMSDRYKKECSPFFTICIPTYNRARTLDRTLKSLEEQTYRDFEVLVVDDGSIDNTLEIVKKYLKLSIRYIRKQNGGKYTALNIGIKEARGYMFVILDSDDWLIDYALEHMHRLWNEIAEKDRNMFSGIMGKCRNAADGKVIGNLFPKEKFISSYVDFHFISGPLNGGYGDCCECNRTEILKQYSFPELQGNSFVPEFYIFDQIGTKYKLLCTNEIFRQTEYLPDGMSMNACVYYRKNYKGILLGNVARLDIVFKNTKEKISIRQKMQEWEIYWHWKKIVDIHNEGEKVGRITIIGILAFITWFWKLII